MTQQPLVDPGLLTVEALRSHLVIHTTLGRTPLDEWSARCRELYLTTLNTHNRQISKLQDGFEPTISAGERPQPHSLNRAATGLGMPRLRCRFLTAEPQVRSQNFPCGFVGEQIQLGQVCSVYCCLYLGYTITPILLIYIFAFIYGIWNKPRKCLISTEIENHSENNVKNTLGSFWRKIHWGRYLDLRRRKHQKLLDVSNLEYLTLRRLMSYIYGAPILDVSRSHTTQHSR
jgi:hypothetical protein